MIPITRPMVAAALGAFYENAKTLSRSDRMAAALNVALATIKNRETCAMSSNTTDADITQQDRERLAREYEKMGWPASAKAVLDGKPNVGELAALRAIASARLDASRPEVTGDVLETALDQWFRDNSVNHREWKRLEWRDRMSRAIAAADADAARGLSLVQWRRPGEFEPTPINNKGRSILVEYADQLVETWWSRNTFKNTIVRWAEMPIPPAWTEAASVAATATNTFEADLSRCGIQGGCERRDVCIAEGICNYTGSLLSGLDVRSPGPALTPPAPEPRWTTEKEALFQQLAEELRRIAQGQMSVSARAIRIGMLYDDAFREQSK